MASGGFIRSVVAVARLAKVVGDGTLADRLVREALSLGALEAKGRRGLDIPRRVAEDSVGMMNLPGAATFDAGPFGEEAPISREFWQKASIRERGQWDLREGVVWAYELIEEGVFFADLTIKEKDLTILIEANRARRGIDKPEKRPRPRNANWGEWIAALATLAHSHKIVPGMNLTSLREAIDDQLDDWNLAECLMSQTTINEALGPVIDCFASTPPSLEKP